MAVSLNALSMVIGMDTSQVSQGATAMRKQLGRANRIMQTSKTDADRLAEGQAALSVAYKEGNITIRQLRKGLEGLDRKYGEGKRAAKQAADEQRRVNRMVKASVPQSAELAMQIRELRKAYAAGNITADQFRRTNRRLRGEYKKVKKGTDDAADEIKRAKDLTRQAETATERYAREVADLNGLLRRGRISQQTYNRSLKKQNAELNQARAATAANIPVVGNLASGMLAGGAAFAGAGIAIAGVTAGLRVLERVAAASIARTRDQMQEIDELAKQSRFLGLAANDLQAFRLAGEELAGLDMRQVDVGLQRVVRRLSEAAAGTGEAKAAFKELGIDAQAIAGLETGDALVEIADSLSQVEDEGERVRLAFKLLDAEGARLALAFSNGGQSIKEMKSELEKLGLTVSEFETEQVEAANDAIGRLDKSLDGLGRTAAVEFAPNIEAASVGLQELISTLGDNTTALGKVGSFLKSSADLVPRFGLAGATADYIDANDALAKQLNREKKLSKEMEELRGKSKDQPPIVDEEELQNLAESETKIESLRSTLQELRGKPSPIISTDDVSMLREAKQLTVEIERQKQFNTAEKRLEAMRQELRLMGLTADEAERRKFALEGATRAQQEEFARLQEQRQAQESQAETEAAKEVAREQGEALKEQFARPAEKLVSEIAELRKLASIQAIDPRTFRLAAQQAAKDFREATKQSETASQPRAIEEGSQEAFKFLTGQQNDRQQKQLAKLEEQRLIQQAMLEAQRQQNRRLDNLATVGRAR